MVGQILVVLGDITRMKVDVIVNAANNALAGGLGVDGAIHLVAGPGLIKECKTLGGCPTGEAKITKGYDLPAKFVIHTVGPVWQGGTHGEDHLLYMCYENSLKLADAKGLKTIAIPAISTGAYHFPKDHAAHIAVSAIRDNLSQTQLEEIILVAHTQEMFDLYHHALKFK